MELQGACAHQGLNPAPMGFPGQRASPMPSGGPDLETLGLPATPTRLYSAHLQGRVPAREGVLRRSRAALPFPTLHQGLTQLPWPLDRIFVASGLLRRREQSSTVTG